ncbi:hypothetical protein M1328_01995 [Patescibacteria group bacterium]|nr:hypothetical protein [Patescibacteria group bacterium]
MKFKSGFTLMEIVIILGIIALIIGTGIALLNPQSQIYKAWDGKRKNDLATLNKVLEDFYNDKGCYPQPSQICYDAGSGSTCHICGSKATSPDFKPYLNVLPCDPQSPSMDILYEVNNNSCPTQYNLYTKLSNTADFSIAELGCQGGCGPYGNCNYNYGAQSPNTGIEHCTITPTMAPPTPTPLYVGLCSTYNPLYYISNGICNVCGSYDQCKVMVPNYDYYVDPGGHGSPGCTQLCYKN